MAKKARKEERRRKKEEKRARKQLKSEEKQKRKDSKKKRRSESIEEGLEMDKSKGSIEVSKPTKKRKVSSRRNAVVERPETSDEQDFPDPALQDSTSEGERDSNSNENLDRSYRPINNNAESNEQDETNEGTSSFKSKTKSNERKGRSRMSISNRRSPRTWNERLEALINFKLEHGHTNVPSRNFYDRGLAEFVVQIKRNPDELNDEQKDKLRDLGFDWSTGEDKKEQAWNENLNRLEQFYKKHKTFAVHKFPELKRLHGWLLWQRNLQRNGGLREDRKDRLEGIGYKDWSKRRKKSNDKIPTTWMRQYNSLNEYFRVNGHSMVPQHKHTENHEDRTLGNWVRKQRVLRNKDCLSGKKITLLEKLNFVWTFDANNTLLRSGKLRHQRKEFDTSLDLLCQYKEDHGSIDNVRGSMMIGGRNVGKWLSNQKSLFRSGKSLFARCYVSKEFNNIWYFYDENRCPKQRPKSPA